MAVPIKATATTIHTAKLATDHLDRGLTISRLRDAELQLRPGG